MSRRPARLRADARFRRKRQPRRWTPSDCHSPRRPRRPPRIGIAGSAPAGIRAQERAVCQEQPANGRSRRTLDLLQACRMTSVRTNENRPANWAFFLKPPTIGGPRVRNQSDRMQRNKATARTKKTCKCRPFRKRLKGFEPSTFCMASRARDSAQRGISLQTGPFCRAGGCRQCPAFTARSREFPD